jgi:hypothetical protein
MASQPGIRAHWYAVGVKWVTVSAFRHLVEKRPYPANPIADIWQVKRIELH